MSVGLPNHESKSGKYLPDFLFKNIYVQVDQARITGCSYFIMIDIQAIENSTFFRTNRFLNFQIWLTIAVVVSVLSFEMSLPKVVGAANGVDSVPPVYCIRVNGGGCVPATFIIHNHSEKLKENIH